MSKYRTLIAIAVCLVLATGMLGTQYLTPDEALEPISINSHWTWDAYSGEYQNPSPGMDTMPDTASGARSVWTGGPFKMRTNRYYLQITYDNINTSADSVNVHIRLFNSWDKVTWFVADSIQILAKPVNLTTVLDSLDGIYGAWAKVVVNDSLTTLDTTFWDIEFYGFDGIVLE